MRAKLRLENIIVSGILLAIVLIFFFKSNAFSYVDEGIAAANNGVITAWREKHPEQVVEDTLNTSSQVMTFSQVCTNFLNGLYSKIQLCELNGGLAKKLGYVDFYKDTGGILLDNGYVVGVYPPTTTDYEIQQMMELQAFCENEGVKLLYVNEPTKYIDDTIIEEKLGQRSFINQNTDLLLNRLSDAGIGYIDLRDNIVEEGKDSFSLFYRTDHHWTTESGKWAAEIIAKELNQNYGFHIDMDKFDDSNYTFTQYEDAWLGEQGMKLSKAYVGLDDFTCIEPNFQTNYTVQTINGICNGTFSETMIDKENYRLGDLETTYGSPSWHYSYLRSGVNQSVIKNNTVEEGKILVLGDSYEQVMVPFLSLGLNEVHTLVLRDYQGSLRDYIKTNDIDTIVISYASFMIGAHDNPNSANYAMFDFH